MTVEVYKIQLKTKVQICRAVLLLDISNPQLCEFYSIIAYLMSSWGFLRIYLIHLHLPRSIFVLIGTWLTHTQKTKIKIFNTVNLNVNRSILNV